MSKIEEKQKEVLDLLYELEDMTRYENKKVSDFVDYLQEKVE